MTDLTAITTPFGLLDRKTQQALKSHGGPWEFLNISGNWDELESPAWQANSTYRAKPAPPKPREWWLRFDMNGNAPIVYGTETEPVTPDGFVVHVREVLPE